MPGRVQRKGGHSRRASSPGNGPSSRTRRVVEHRSPAWQTTYKRAPARLERAAGFNAFDFRISNNANQPSVNVHSGLDAPPTALSRPSDACVPSTRVAVQTPRTSAAPLPESLDLPAGIQPSDSPSTELKTADCSHRRLRAAKGTLGPGSQAAARRAVYDGRTDFVLAASPAGNGPSSRNRRVVSRPWESGRENRLGGRRTSVHR